MYVLRIGSRVCSFEVGGYNPSGWSRHSAKRQVALVVGRHLSQRVHFLSAARKKREVDGGVQLCLLFPLHSVLDPDLHIQGWFPFSGVALWKCSYRNGQNAQGVSFQVILSPAFLTTRVNRSNTRILFYFIPFFYSLLLSFFFICFVFNLLKKSLLIRLVNSSPPSYCSLLRLQACTIICHTYLCSHVLYAYILKSKFCIFCLFLQPA